MKRFLFLVLCSISLFPITSNAANVGSLVDSLLKKFGSDKVYSQHCVSDCVTLGYTVKPSELNGRTDCIACPFELECDTGKTISSPRWYNCPSYSCNDLGLLDKHPEGVSCVSVTAIDKPGLTGTCYSCQCAEGELKTTGCEKKLADLNDSPLLCSSLGYRNSVTECENYLACPSDPNKVHCLADTCENGQPGCTQTIELPKNATGITKNLTCCDGETTKDVIVNFKCNPGYTLSASKTYCEETTCGPNEFKGPEDALKGATENLDDCSKNRAAGWKKVKTSADGVCYTCQCLLDEIKGGNPSAEARELLAKYPYTQTLSDESLDEMACDNKHYKKCSCPANQQPKIRAADSFKPLFTLKEVKPGLWQWDEPPADDIIAEPKFSDCCKSANPDDQHNYVSGFTCSEANGWVLTQDGTSCEATPCIGDENGIYYSDEYTSASSCKEKIGGSGWSYTAGKSGGKLCGQCKCTASTGRFNEASSDNRGLVEYGDPVCDGRHWNSCTLKPEAQELYQKESDFFNNYPNVSPSSYIKVKLCGENYIRKTGFGCEDGYELIDGFCKEKQCNLDIYNISEDLMLKLTEISAIEEHHSIAFEECQSGSTKYYHLTTCGPESTNYAVNSDKTGCCQICDTAGGWSVALCEEGKLKETKTSDCDKSVTCYLCSE